MSFGSFLTVAMPTELRAEDQPDTLELFAVDGDFFLLDTELGLAAKELLSAERDGKS